MPLELKIIILGAVLVGFGLHTNNTKLNKKEKLDKKWKY